VELKTCAIFVFLCVDLDYNVSQPVNLKVIPSVAVIPITCLLHKKALKKQLIIEMSL